MKIYIGADHGGFEQKASLIEYLSNKGHEVIDKGAFEFDPGDDYPDFAFAVAEAVAKDPGSKGILSCRSSIGVCVAANKVQSIFASSVRTPEEAIEDRQHHDSNVVCLSGDHMTFEEMKSTIDAWLATEFDGGRHTRRRDKIMAYEKQ